MKPPRLKARRILHFIHNMMKQFSIFLVFLFFLSACAPAPRVVALTISTATLPAPTVTPTSVPPSPTATPIPCNPLAADFCIVTGHFVLQRPIQPPANDSVAETYRYASTAEGTREPHHGVEFINATGTPVYAAADGQIVFAGPDEEAVYSPRSDFYGNLIVIRHADNLFTLYAHLSALGVQAGQDVLAGQKIGEVGSTGAAIGSHLHFEVRRGDVQDYFSTQNPELWLALKADEGALAVSVKDARGMFQQARLTVQSGGRNYFVETYSADFPPAEENAALGGLKSGRYRITFYFEGEFFERWVDVEADRLTQVWFVVK